MTTTTIAPVAGTSLEDKLKEFFEVGNFKEWSPESPILIAGGCLRDALFDKEVKDIDVFIGVSEGELEECRGEASFTIMASDATYAGIMSGWLSASAIPDFPRDIRFHVNSDDTYPLGEFLSGTSEQVPGLNVILTKHKSVSEMWEWMKETFPCSISQIAYNPTNGDLMWTDAFEVSARTKVIEFPVHVTQKYEDKIFPKYDGWSKKYVVEEPF